MKNVHSYRVCSFKQGLLCLAKGHNAVTLVRFKPRTPPPQSPVKHSTTKSLCSLYFYCRNIARLAVKMTCNLNFLTLFSVLPWRTAPHVGNNALFGSHFQFTNLLMILWKVVYLYCIHLTIMLYFSGRNGQKRWWNAGCNSKIMANTVQENAGASCATKRWWVYVKRV